MNEDAAAPPNIRITGCPSRYAVDSVLIRSAQREASTIFGPLWYIIAIIVSK
ncbi:Uncharacterised protein [Mycobacteroides abscessus subsp. abscessus]|nr:Uncharacterised protein [Mycobacteroides abscessus subsp. abscessus]SKU11105.1 Uncharacterised protein [Mycobacteroides abscessus subsp. abscessus]